MLLRADRDVAPVRCRPPHSTPGSRGAAGGYARAPPRGATKRETADGEVRLPGEAEAMR